MKCKRVDEVVAYGLCVGCGACAAVCPSNSISMADMPDEGLRPIVDLISCLQCKKCVEVCPGIDVSHLPFGAETIPELRKEWGPILEIYEGYARDNEIRYKGSSGGVATALALYCIEKKHFSGVLHIGPKPGSPLHNTALISRTRKDLVERMGSRYSPAAPCEGFKLIEKVDSNWMFIGKPCDVAALRKYQILNPLLRTSVGLAVSVFCAGTPTTRGTHNVLAKLGVQPSDVNDIRYRGFGWPGKTVVVTKGNRFGKLEMKYSDSWEILSHYKQFRCDLCPDSTGEFADISCGDPWHLDIDKNQPGCSLVIVRTERGRNVLQWAIRDGYVNLEQIGPGAVQQSQSALLGRRRCIWGRLLVMKVLGLGVPHFTGFSLYNSWRLQSLQDKIRSVLWSVACVLSKMLRQSRYCRGYNKLFGSQVTHKIALKESVKI